MKIFTQDFVNGSNMDEYGYLELVRQQSSHVPACGDIFMDFEGNDYWIVGDEGMMNFVDKSAMVVVPSHRVWNDIVMDYGPMIKQDKVPILVF